MLTRTFLIAIVDALIEASQFNQNDQVAPVAILWPDEERQWVGLIPQLRTYLPILTLGEYEPETQTGPAYWLRCMIDGTLTESPLPQNHVPIIYLPGYSKQDLRAIEACPKLLQPLAELQYRGLLWVHRNGRDWTVAGFLHSLEIVVGADNATKEALVRALSKLAMEPIASLKQASPLRADFFNQLLHPDAVRQLLLWLNDPDGFQNSIDNAEWIAFCALCRQKYGIQLTKDGPISAAEKLGGRDGEWGLVWQRFIEMPETYPNIPDYLRQARPQQPMLFDGPEEVWPQDNEAMEANLRTALTGLKELLADVARVELFRLDAEHRARRSWVWARLGHASLAEALAHLKQLAEGTKKQLTGTTVTGIAEAYTSWGWQVDAAVLEALGAVSTTADVTAIKSAILPLYRPWLETAATQFQQVIATNPATQYQASTIPNLQPGTCLLFSDALRYDVGQRLFEALQIQGYACEKTWHLAALPTVTATAKAAVSPVVNAIIGGDKPDLNPVTKENQTSLNATVLRKLIVASGHQVLIGDDFGDPDGTAWTEWGAVDRYGHEYGWKIAHHVRGEVQTLVDRITSLLAHGWQRILIVTDHGWLLLPDGMPKAELPQHLTVKRKGRCAVLKEGAVTDQQIIPWHWNPDVRIAIAPNIHCYEAGKEYEHGGISPQECVVPIITVEQDKHTVIQVNIKQISWRGLRCYVQLSGINTDVEVDIRIKAADLATSLAETPKKTDEEGKVSLLITKEDHEGDAVFVVVTYGGSLLAQQLTVVGGE